MNIPRQLLRFFTSVIFLGFFSGSAIAGSAVAIDCPCNLSRINPTAVELDFNLVFTQNLNQSGPLEVIYVAMIIAMRPAVASIYWLKQVLSRLVFLSLQCHLRLSCHSILPALTQAT